MISYRRLVLLSFFWTAGLMAISCRREPDLTGYPKVDFETQVKPIFIANCTQSGCHSSSGGEEFPLETYNDIVSQVTPYKAYKSEAYKAIVGKGLEFMPPSGPLPDDQIRTIFVWIEQGAPKDTL